MHLPNLGNLGTDGSVAYLFNKIGYIFYSQADEDELFDFAIEEGADIENTDDRFIISCSLKYI